MKTANQTIQETNKIWLCFTDQQQVHFAGGWGKDAIRANARVPAHRWLLGKEKTGAWDEEERPLSGRQGYKITGRKESENGLKGNIPLSFPGWLWLWDSGLWNIHVFVHPAYEQVFFIMYNNFKRETKHSRYEGFQCLLSFTISHRLLAQKAW